MNVKALEILGKIDKLREFINEETILHSISRVDKYTVNFKFSARKISSEAKILRIIGLNHWRNITDDEPVYNKYTGTDFIIYNTTSNCHKAVSPKDKYVYETCKQENYRDPTIIKWKEEKINITDEHLPPAQIFKTPEKTYIYCFLHKIRIKDRDYSCPTNVISLPLTMPFSLINHDHYVTSVTKLINLRELPPTHITSKTTYEDDALENQALLIHQARNSKRKAKELLDEKLQSFQIPKEFNLITTTTLTSIIVLLIIIITCAYKTGQSKKPTETINIIQTPTTVNNQRPQKTSNTYQFGGE